MSECTWNRLRLHFVPKDKSGFEIMIKLNYWKIMHITSLA